MPEVKIVGTRFHRVAIINSENELVLIAVVSTPLCAEELRKFIRNRVDENISTIYVSERDKPADPYKPGIIGLSTLEEWLKKLLPEQVLEELSVTITDRGMHIKRKEEECK